MPRTVTVTFGDGSSHVYNGVPDDITPDAVIARAGQEFVGKQIKNIDGGKTALPQPPTARPQEQSPVFDPMRQQQAEGIRASYAGPDTGTQQDWFQKQQAIETQLRAAGRTDEEIQQDPEWQDAARNLSRSVSATGTQTAIGLAGGELLPGGEAVAGAARLAGKAFKPVVGMVRDAIGHESTAVAGAVKKEAQMGLEELTRDAAKPVAARDALTKVTEGRPDAKILEVEKPAPLDTAKVTQARQQTAALNRQLSEANTRLQQAQRNLSSLDKYAGQRRSEAMVRAARRDLNKAQTDVNRLTLQRDEAIESQKTVDAEHRQALKEQKAGERQTITSQKQITQAASKAEGEVKNLKDLAARLNAAKSPSDIAAAARNAGKLLSKADKLPPDYYERINQVVEKAKSTAEARKQLMTLLRGALIGAGFGAGAGTIYELRRFTP